MEKPRPIVRLTDIKLIPQTLLYPDMGANDKIYQDRQMMGKICADAMLAAIFKMHRSLMPCKRGSYIEVTVCQNHPPLQSEITKVYLDGLPDKLHPESLMGYIQLDQFNKFPILQDVRTALDSIHGVALDTKIYVAPRW